VRTPIFDDTEDDELRGRYQEALASKGLDPDAVAAQVVHALAQPAGVNRFEIALMSTGR
jgi:NADP-dependent 3-hydroxy acid dehydrogenase YdfG